MRASPGHAPPAELSARLAGGARRAAGAAAGHATSFGYISGWRLVRLLPESAARALFARIADRMYAADGAGVRRLRANLRRVRPGASDVELDELTRAAVRSYLRYWCESFRLPSWPIDDVVRRTRVRDEHILRDAHAAGGGVVVALPHMANWDWAGAWACATGLPLTTVAERLRPERLYDEFVAYRASLGIETLPAGDHATYPALVDRIRSGRLVCLLADRDLGRGGVEVALCGEPATMPPGAAALAREAGAPLIPAILWYDGPDLVLDIRPPVPHVAGAGGVVAMMQCLADVFTDGIREHPEDWHMMQRVFRADRGAG